MSSIVDSIKNLLFWIIHYNLYIRAGIYLLHIIIIAGSTPFILELVGEVLREWISASMSNYLDIESGDVPPESEYLDQTNRESKFTQLEAKRYDPIRDRFIEDKPSSPRPWEPNSLFDRSRAPSPEQQKVEMRQEQQRVQMGEGSNSNLPDSRITFPIDISKLSDVQKDYAHKYLDVTTNYTKRVRALHQHKNVTSKGPDFEATIIAERDAFWQERQTLREYAKNHFDLHQPKDIHKFVEAVTGCRVY